MNIFGTDGVRGRANDGFITPFCAVKLAAAIVNYYANSGNETVHSKFSVVIGKDTRLSGYMLEQALTAGFVAAGADVFLLGPIPTPAVALMTKSLRADLGVVVSASHNPYYDNGIKLFNSNGLKISRIDELAISEIFQDSQQLATPDKMGKAKRLDDISGRYIEFAKSSFPKNLGLFSMKIVVDSANGASYKIAPQVFWELGAQVISIGADPDGLNINKDCGALDTKLLQKSVVDNQANIGIALDGDADRLIVVDETGSVLDGDYVIAAIAVDWLERDLLSGKNVVLTTMSNMALENFLLSRGINVVRSDVGDKLVVEKMIEIGANLGGEKSGHIIPFDFSTTGDGIIAALQVLAYIKRKNVVVSSIKTLFTPYPQEIMNIHSHININNEAVQNALNLIKHDILGRNSRVISRHSGTENLTRIMLESDDKFSLMKAVDFIKNSPIFS
ncbi:phosphoglucosamine mutase [Alphaproteobacteria bacterium]|nr:phosphoglucosamine mutase [Alphaproteobacteria bacterium]